MTTMNSKIYLARVGGSGEDENYALGNGVAVLDFRVYSSLAGITDPLGSKRNFSSINQFWMLVKESTEE